MTQSHLQSLIHAGELAYTARDFVRSVELQHDAFKLSPQSGDLAEALSKSYKAVLQAGDITALQTERRVALCRDQLGFDGLVCPAPFHFRVVELMQGRDATALQAVAQEVWRAFAPMLRNGDVTESVALVILMLREQLKSPQQASVIQPLGAHWCQQFSSESFKLPYRNVFGECVSRANLADLVTLTGQPHAIEQLAQAHEWQKLLFIEWSTGQDLPIDPKALQASLMSSEAAFRHPNDLKAAIMLGLKRWPSIAQQELQAPLLLKHPKLVQLGQSISHVKERLACDAQSLGARAIDMARIESPWRQKGWALKHRVERKLGISKKRRPRVAICVSGQLRGYEKALATWREVLTPLFDVAFFVHTWSKVGRASADPVRYVLPFEGQSFTVAYRKACAEHGYAAIRNRYPAIIQMADVSPEVSADELRQRYGTQHVVIEDDQSEPFRSMSNQEKMHYKIHACHTLLNQSGGPYDLIMRLRPDKALREFGIDPWALVDICSKARVLFGDHAQGQQFGNLFIGDQFAAATPDVMQVYADAWSLCPQLKEVGAINCAPAFTGHVSLAHACWLHDINVRKAPVAFGALLEAAPISAREVEQCLQKDSAGRHDATDRMLLDAALEDLRQ